MVVVYIFLLHVALLWLIWQRYGPKIVFCRRRAITTSRTSQVNTFPNVADTTVEGLRREAQRMGLRTDGLRAALESRLSGELMSRSSDNQ